MQRHCNKARDVTHTAPEHQAVRRGGQYARENKAAADAADREAAAARAAAAAGTGSLGSFHNLRSAGSIRLPARFRDGSAASDDDTDDDDFDNGSVEDSDAASEDSDFFP